MPYQKLQLKLLSKGGELLRCINCFAGQITVFRGYSSIELQPYQRALAGIPGPEKIVVSLDGDTYAPEKAVLVGFGENFDPGQTIAGFLQASGVPHAAIQMQLRNCGIDAQENTPAESLLPDQRRRLRLLAAMYARDQVLVLNNPFEELASNWKERFAEELCNVTQSRNLIVVVPSLTYRPEGWINNDFISRIQVGQNTQRTIGFGTDATQMNELVQHLRASFQDEQEVKNVMKSAQAAQQWRQEQSKEVKQAPAPPTSAPSEVSSVDATQVIPPEAVEAAVKAESRKVKKKSRRSSSGRSKSTGGISTLLSRVSSGRNFRRAVPAVIGVVCLGVFFLNGGLSYFIGGEAPDPEQKGVAQVASNSVPEVKDDPDAQTGKKEITPREAMRTAMVTRNRGGGGRAEGVRPAGKTPERKKPEGETLQAVARPEKDAPRINKDHKPNPRAKYVLDLYPANVRTSVLKSFDSSIPKTTTFKRAVAKKAEKSKTGSQSDLFSLLQGTSGSGKDLPPTPLTSAPSRRPGTAAKSTGSRRPATSTLSREEIEERRKRIRQKFLEAIERRAQQRGK
jgi:ABC-type multidrug transport system ATPase subunit